MKVNFIKGEIIYTFIAPSQLHRFIELLKESGQSLAGKWAI